MRTFSRFSILLIVILSIHQRADAHQIKISSMEFQIGNEKIFLYAPLVPIEVLADTTTVDENRPLSKDQLAEVFRYFGERLTVQENDVRLTFVGESAAVFHPDTATMSPTLFRDTSPLDHLVVAGFFERSKRPGYFVPAEALTIEGKELFREMGAYPPLAVGRVKGQGYDEVQAFDGFAPWTEPASSGLWPKVISAAAGIWRVFTFYDHILLLLGLNLLSPRFRESFKNIAAFVMAFVIASAADIIAMPPLFIEPVIALTILYVGIENLLSPLPRGRWKIAIVFGLIHGLDSLGTTRYPEIVGALSIAILLGMGVRSPLRQRTVQAGSVAVSMAGLYGFIERVFL